MRNFEGDQTNAFEATSMMRELSTDELDAVAGGNIVTAAAYLKLLAAAAAAAFAKALSDAS